MLSRRILTVLGIALAACAWMVFWEQNNDFVVPLGICLLLGIVVYTFQYQIDMWWTKKKEPTLDNSMRNMLMHTGPFFQSLDTEERDRFEKRMVQWVQAKEFIMQGGEDMPEDLKFITAYYAILLTTHKKDFMYDGLDRVAFYPHVFLTPKYNDDVHACEVEMIDGTFIFAIQQLMHGHLEPKKYYNILIHTFAEALKLMRPDAIPTLSNDLWPKLHQISNISKEKIDAFIGIEQTDVWPMAVHHYFTYPKYMSELAPDVYAAIKDWHEGLQIE